jgi:putative spermidine/putrescine transport system permease protein
VPAVTVLVVLFGGALLGGMAQTLRLPEGGLGLGMWREVIADPALADALRFTLRVTVVATLVSAALALPLGRLVRDLLWTRLATTVPVLVPHLVVGVLAVAWIGPGGLADRLLGGLPIDLIRDPAGIGIVAVYVYKETPFLALLVAAAWDPATRAREEAAAVLGAGRWARWRTVVWPSVRPALIAGSLVVAAFVLGAFEVPLMVGPSYPKTLATLALDHTRSASLAGDARASAVLLLAAALALLLALPAARLARRHDA